LGFLGLEIAAGLIGLRFSYSCGQLKSTIEYLRNRFFDGNLTTDLKPDGQKELKNGVFILFPRVFGRAKILSEIFSKLASP